MTQAIRLHVLASDHLTTAIMNSAMLQLREDHAFLRWTVQPAWVGKHTHTVHTLHPARGAKPFVLRVLHEFAALCEE